MTDIRRTLLWVVFSVSLVLTWDAWNKYNGKPGIFTPVPPAATAPAATPAVPSSTQAAAPAPNSGVRTAPTTSAGVPGAPAAPAVAAPAPAVPSEKVTVTTDLVKATFDSKGGD